MCASLADSLTRPHHRVSIHPAKTGGSSRIISSVTVYNELLRRHGKDGKGQQYARRLFGRVLLFTRKTFGLSTHFPVHPFRQDALGVLRSYWNQDFYRKSYRLDNGTLTAAGERDPFVLEAVEAYDAILRDDATAARSKDKKQADDDYEELGLDMVLEQGDIQLVSNHFVMHARTEFEDFTDDVSK